MWTEFSFVLADEEAKRNAEKKKSAEREVRDFQQCQ